MSNTVQSKNVICKTSSSTTEYFFIKGGDDADKFDINDTLLSEQGCLFYSESRVKGILPTIIPAKTKHTSTIFFFHGFGDYGPGWSDDIVNVRPPYMKVICPTADYIKTKKNYNGPNCAAWFDEDRRYLFRDEDAEGIKNTSQLIHRMIDEEISKYNISSERIIVGGFAQGGAIALYAALTYPKKLAGIVAWCTWLPMYRIMNNITSASNRNIHILQGHGKLDDVVDYKYGHYSSEILRKISNNTVFITYPENGHAMSEEGSEHVKKFIQSRVGPI